MNATNRTSGRLVWGALVVAGLSCGISLWAAMAGDTTRETVRTRAKEFSVDQLQPVSQVAAPEENPLNEPIVSPAFPVKAKVIPRDSASKAATHPLPDGGDSNLRRVAKVRSVPVPGAAVAPPSVLAGTGTGEGDPCDCDSDCIPSAICKTLECNPNTGICGNAQGLETNSAFNTRCNEDGDFCTDGRCDGSGNCIDGVEMGTVQRCAKECVGGNENGRNCLRDADCGGGLCLLQSPAVCDETNNRCEIGPAAEGIGRCCDSGTCTFTDEGSCTGDWYRLADPDDQDTAGECYCPKYSSGIRQGTADIDTLQVRQYNTECATGENLCENTNFCLRRCSAAAIADRVCTVDSDCFRCDTDNTVCDTVGGVCSGAGTCLTGTCADDPCVFNANRCDAAGTFTRIGDDYSFANGSFLRLKEIKFRGGVVNPGEEIVFEFYDNNDPPRFVDAITTGNLAEAGVLDYDFEADCFPDCDALEQEVELDPPMIIPPQGWMVVRATRSDTNGDNILWVSTTAAAVTAGSNNAALLWHGTEAGDLRDDFLAGDDVLKFDLVGIKLSAAEAMGACCDPAVTTTCQELPEYLCRRCNVDDTTTCSRFPDCGPSTGVDFCNNTYYFGAKEHVDFINPGPFVFPQCGMNGEPCNSGACCDPATGECVLTDEDTCDGLFGAGQFEGAGTTCDPNCCEQPTFTGGDCCEDTLLCSDGSGACGMLGQACGVGGTCQLCKGAFDHVMNPPPVSGTCAGGTLLCSDGSGTCGPQGSACGIQGTCEDCPVTVERIISGDTSLEPPVFGKPQGDTCTFDVDDLGHYVRFSLTDDGIVFLDMCCSPESVRPFIYIILNDGCPCSPTQIPKLLDRDENDEPRCCGLVDCNQEVCCPVDNNFVGIYTLPAGDYSYQIFSEKTCSLSGTDCENSQDCPAGQTCDEHLGPYQVHIRVEGAPTAACCLDIDPAGEECVVLNRLDCEDHPDGGFWLGPKSVGGQSTPTCFANPCNTGACCRQSPRECNETAGFNTWQDCHTDNINNKYFGGADCVLDQPCPVCEIEGPANCKDWQAGRFIVVSDRQFEPFDYRWADNFATVTGTADTLCWYPGYSGNCNTGQDLWEVKFYDDDFGLPGVQVGPTQVIPAASITKKVVPGFFVWEYSAPLPTAVNFATTGDCMWIEITGLGISSCFTRLTESTDGDRYSAVDRDGQYGPEDIVSFQDGEFTDVADFAFCLSSGIGGDDCDVDAPCCTCDDMGCACSLQSPDSCILGGGYYHPGESSCGAISCTPPSNDDCAGAGTITSNRCVGGTSPPDTACTTDANCMGGGKCTGAFVSIDTRSATTDGLGDTCTPNADDPSAFFVNDVWYEYTAPCSGEMTFQTCGQNTRYDSILALYHGTSDTCACPSNTCVGGTNNGNACTSDLECPGTCVGGTTPGAACTASGGCPGTIINPGSCNADCVESNIIKVPNPPNADLNVCLDDGDPTLTTTQVLGGLSCTQPHPNQDLIGRSIGKVNVTGGNCYLLRVGGFAGSNQQRQGVGELRIAVECAPFAPPAAAPIVGAVDHSTRKNRFVSFAPNNSVPVAFRLRHVGTGAMKWILPPVGALDIANNVVRLTGDGMAGTFNAGTMVTTWTQAVLHATGCLVSPVQSYEVEACTDGSTCSTPLLVGTILKPGAKFWADTNGPFAVQWSGPDLLVNFTDVSGAVQAFQNAPTKPHVTWVDLIATAFPGDPNLVINFGDINGIISGFQGNPYPGTAPGSCP